MKWLFTLLAVLSLILFLTFAAMRLWAPHGRDWSYYADDQRYSVTHATRWIRFEIHEGRRTPHVVNGQTQYSFGGKLMDGSWQRTRELPLRIIYGRSPVSAVGADPRLAYYRNLAVPTWLLLLISAILPALWTIITFRAVRRRRRAARLHLCPHCSYDLRASTDRCPECGTLIPVAKSPLPST